MFYKKYDLSKSLSGDKIIYIARNAAGIVVIRAPSLEELKKEIDRREEEEKKRLLAAKRAAEKAMKKLGKGRKKEKPTQLAAAEEAEKPSTTEKASSSKLPPRGPNGKFISRQPETETTKKKKGFWDRLVG